MSNSTHIFDFADLWVVDADDQEAWLDYFDWLTQFEISRRSLRQAESPQLMIAPRFLPCKYLAVVNFVNPNAVSQMEVLWKNLGRPKTTLFCSQEKRAADRLELNSSFFHMKAHP